MPRPWSRYQTEIHPPNLAAGLREGARRYGLLIDTLDWRFVSGLAYFSVPPAPENEIPARLSRAAIACAWSTETPKSRIGQSSGSSPM